MKIAMDRLASIFRFPEKILTPTPNQWSYPRIPSQAKGRTRGRHDTWGGDAVAVIDQALRRDD
ncbi:hypothetical protein [Bradyrhizobium sp. USDA 4353]